MFHLERISPFFSSIIIFSYFYYISMSNYFAFIVLVFFGTLPWWPRIGQLLLKIFHLSLRSLLLFLALLSWLKLLLLLPLMQFYWMGHQHFSAISTNIKISSICLPTLRNFLTIIEYTCKNRSSFFHHHNSTIKFLALRWEVQTSTKMQGSTHKTTHRKSSSKVIYNSVRTWFLSKHLKLYLLFNIIKILIVEIIYVEYLFNILFLW